MSQDLIIVSARFGVLAGLALLVACESGEAVETDDAVARPPAGQPALESAPPLAEQPQTKDADRPDMPGDFSDSRVQDAVIHELREDGVRLESVSVEVDDGVVSLAGAVDSLAASRRATDIASAIRGVKSVSNGISVRTPIMTDGALRQATKDALLFDPATESFEVAVEAEDGKVTISGAVDSFAERQLVEETVAGVRGIEAVENNLVVAYESKRSDTEIRNDIVGLLESSAWIDDNNIEVEVADGKVTLTGKVGSLTEKNEAERRSWVAGVDAVDTTGIEVDWMAADSSLREKRYTSRTDAQIRDAIKTAFLYDPRVFSFNPSIRVEDGVVTLSGTVENLRAKAAAEQVAASTLGVWRVKNRLQVEPADRPADALLVTRIDDAFGRDPYLDRYDITVSAVNGHVYLHGTVDSLFEANRAVWVASGPKGVVEVNNHLRVDSPAHRLSRWELREDVVEELFWSPFVDADEVQVEVEGDTVTLSGVVDTWSEWRAAEENAYEGGAARVTNNLQVRYGPEYYQPDDDEPGV